LSQRKEKRFRQLERRVRALELMMGAYFTATPQPRQGFWTTLSSFFRRKTEK